MKREIGTGVQDFESLRVNNRFYVDKTGLIREWWNGGDAVTLITRPRRFGKTLNMSMLNCFFSTKYANRADLFEGLRVWEDPAMRKEQGQWPVIFLSFAGIKGTTYADTMIQMKKVLVKLFSAHPELYEAKNLATYHHERWDGTGYPAGLSGEGIPLSSRIMAVADVFDALISTRSYKKGFPYEKAPEIIQEESGSHFDPNVVDAFLASKDKILAIAEEFHEMELDHFSFGKNL